MYLWDTNIVRAFIQEHPNLRLHLNGISWAQIGLPSVVVAEILNGRCEFALKATPAEAPLAHLRLMETHQLIARFNVVIFDELSASTMERLRQKHRKSKRYADLMIAAMAVAGGHVIVTRNQSDFNDLLPKTQLANWIDDPPK